MSRVARSHSPEIVKLEERSHKSSRSRRSLKPVYHRSYLGEFQYHSGHWPSCRLRGTQSLLESLFISHLEKP